MSDKVDRRGLAVRHYSISRSAEGTIGLSFYRSDDASNYVVTELAPNVSE